LEEIGGSDTVKGEGCELKEHGLRSIEPIGRVGEVTG